jgi:hypothetical protein
MPPPEMATPTCSRHVEGKRRKCRRDHRNRFHAIAIDRARARVFERFMNECMIICFPCAPQEPIHSARGSTSTSAAKLQRAPPPRARAPGAGRPWAPMDPRHKLKGVLHAYARVATWPCMAGHGAAGSRGPAHPLVLERDCAEGLLASEGARAPVGVRAHRLRIARHIAVTPPYGTVTEVSHFVPGQYCVAWPRVVHLQLPWYHRASADDPSPGTLSDGMVQEERASSTNAKRHVRLQLVECQ